MGPKQSLEARIAVLINSTRSDESISYEDLEVCNAFIDDLEITPEFEKGIGGKAIFEYYTAVNQLHEEVEGNQRLEDFDLVITSHVNVLQDPAIQQSYRIPVMYLNHQKTPEEIVNSNTWKVVEDPLLLLTAVIQGIREKRHLDNILTHNDFLRDLDEKHFEQMIQDQLTEIKESKKERGLGGHPVSKFEALYSLVKDMPAKSVFGQLTPQSVISSAVKDLEYHQEMKDGSRSHYENSTEILNTLWDSIEKLPPFVRKAWLRSPVAVGEVGGSTLSEEGARLRFGLNPQLKYSAESGLGFYFLRDVYGRKGISGEDIARVRFTDAEEARKRPNKLLNGKTPRIWAPVPLGEKEHKESLLVQEMIIGVDLGVLYEKFIRQKVNSKMTLEPVRQKYKHLRDALVDTYLGRLKNWQMNAPELPKELKMSQSDLVHYFRKNHKKIGQTLQRFPDITPEMEDLWDYCAQLYSLNALSMGRGRTVVRSLDASPQNLVLRTNRYFTKLADIEKLFTSKDKVDQKLLDENLYHVDQGYTTTHFLEDFFHIVDSAEAFYTRKQEHHETAVGKNEKRFIDFINRERVTKDHKQKDQFYIMGFYRNMRRADLAVYYEEKNYQKLKRNMKSQTKYNEDRSAHNRRWQHHVPRAQAYMDAYFKHCTSKIRQNYDKLPVGMKAEFDDALAEQNELMQNPFDPAKWLNHLDLAGKTTKNDKKLVRKTLQQRGLAYCLGQLCNYVQKRGMPMRWSA